MKRLRIRRLGIVLVALAVTLSACSTTKRQEDMNTQKAITDALIAGQRTPNDIEYSLERYNLIRRTYWVNGMRERALTLPCPITKPLGYIVLLLDGVGTVGNFTVDGKVTSLNSFLTPDSEYYASSQLNEWLADVDGSYGANDDGIFFFTTDGKYIEWTGTYLYSDIPFIVEEPILKIGG